MFRLAKVLEWKELLEKEARAERLRAEQRATDLARDAARTRSERRSFPDDQAADAGIEELAAWAKRSELLRRRETALLQRLESLRPELEAKRAAHLELRRDVESLRKLRDRTLREQRRRRERAAQELLDDAGARRFLPGAGNGFPIGVPLEREGEPSNPDPGAARTAPGPSGR